MPLFLAGVGGADPGRGECGLWLQACYFTGGNVVFDFGQVGLDTWIGQVEMWSLASDVLFHRWDAMILTQVGCYDSHTQIDNCK
jgi:hypothetical protein